MNTLRKNTFVRATAVLLLLSAACVFLNLVQPAAAEPQAITLTIVKRVEGAPPASNWTFSLTDPLGRQESFTIAAAGGSVQKRVAAGTYFLNETEQEGWTPSAKCTGGSGATGSNSVHITLVSNTTCTFTNTAVQAPLTGAYDRYDKWMGSESLVRAPGVLANDMLYAGQPTVYLWNKWPWPSSRLSVLTESGSWDYVTQTVCPNVEDCRVGFTAVSHNGRTRAFYVRKRLGQWGILEFLIQAPVSKVPNIMEGTGAAPINDASPLTATVVNGEPRIYYLSKAQNTVQELAWDGEDWHYGDISSVAGAPPATARTSLVATFATNGDPHVYYQADVNGSVHIQELAYSSLSEVWETTDVTAAAGAMPVSAGDPIAMTTYRTDPRVYFLGSGHVYELAWYGGAWHNRRLTPDDPKASADAGGLAAINNGDSLRVYYTHNNVIQELATVIGGWAWRDVGSQTGVGTVVSSSLAAISIQGIPHVYYTAVGPVEYWTQPNKTQYLHELSWTGAKWRDQDISAPFAGLVGGWLLDERASSRIIAVTGGGLPMTANLIQGAEHGQLDLRQDGSFWYKPFDGYAGPDSFTYFADNGFVKSEAVTVDLNVVDAECAPVADNFVQNFCFTEGKDPWSFYDDTKKGEYRLNQVGQDTYAGSSSAEIVIGARGRNVQFYQQGLQLEPATEYELAFAAHSNNGRDMSVWVHRHSLPTENYGLRGRRVNLTKDWKYFTVRFTTPNAQQLDKARLRFWFSGAPEGTVYLIDHVVLTKVNP